MKELHCQTSHNTQIIIVINKADKSSTIVILTRSDYIHRGVNHLADEAIYEPLLEDISGELKSNINLNSTQMDY